MRRVSVERVIGEDPPQDDLYDMYRTAFDVQTYYAVSFPATG